jgi:Ca-activated chloride channel family protein
MSRLASMLVVPWIALGLSTASPSHPQGGDSEKVSSDPLVFFLSPAENQPALGEVEMEIEVLGDPVDEIVFLVDGLEVARSSHPPYRVKVSLGDDFGPHLFEATVNIGGVEIARVTRETPALRIDERIDLELQQLYVTVSASNDSPRRLAVGDFRVLDSRLPQRVVTFEEGDAPLTVALLVDASASMSGGRLSTALEGARAFLRGMHDLDEASVYLFADWLLYRSPFLRDPTELAGTIDQVEAGGGTAVNDSLYLALEDLEIRQGRRVVVLLSDGVDIHSILRIRDVLWAMRRSRSLVYWIELEEQAMQSGLSSPWRDSEEHFEERKGLGRLVAESGGRVVRIQDVEEARTAFTEILSELRSQYVIGYYPTVNLNDGRWHPVDVRILSPGYSARTRGGYVDY